MALLIFAVFMAASMFAGICIGLKIERRLHGATNLKEDDCNE